MIKIEKNPKYRGCVLHSPTYDPSSLTFLDTKEYETVEECINELEREWKKLIKQEYELIQE